jgi:ABC-type antimicrobial peptide transport system permease subunit
MFKNPLKISLRTILKDRTYSIINITGLTIGIMCSLFLLMYIMHEVSYDRYHANVMLVSTEFFILVGIGMILAFPAAWYFINDWLQNFAYRIALEGEWPTFVISALLAFFITGITVGFHVIRAASANPVRSLRDE